MADGKTSPGHVSRVCLRHRTNLGRRRPQPLMWIIPAPMRAMAAERARRTGGPLASPIDAGQRRASRKADDSCPDHTTPPPSTMTDDRRREARWATSSRGSPPGPTAAELLALRRQYEACRVAHGGLALQCLTERCAELSAGRLLMTVLLSCTGIALAAALFY